MTSTLGVESGALRTTALPSARATRSPALVSPRRTSTSVVSTAVSAVPDHRMAMSFSLLGLVHPGIGIADPGCVAKTFPDYFEVLDSLR